MIDQQTRQRIIDTAQILDVVSDFVSLRRQGISYVGLCPFHSDRHPSFYVTPSKNICKCFSCGEGGTPLNFIMKHEQLSYTEALKYLAKKYNIEVVEREETEEEKQRNNERESLFIVNDFAAKFFQQQLTATEEGHSIGLSYFRERGIRPETIEKFGLGYSPEDKSALSTQAQKAGYSLKRLIDVGLCTQYEDRPGLVLDRFRGRIIFPVRNLSGRYVAFGGRVMSSQAKTAKYVNSPESIIYSKSRELYGLYWAKGAISKANKCYLVEGYTDVLSMHQAGIEHVVSSSGTALTLDQIRLLRRFTPNITVLYDGDAAGIRAALRGIDLLLEEGCRIKVVLLPEGEDPDSFARSHSPSELKAFLDAEETDFIHFKIQLYQEEMQRDPMRRAELISDIMRSIALIPDSIQRAVLLQSSASLLRMDEQLLISEVNKLRRQGITAHPYATAPARPAPPAQPQQSAATANPVPQPSPSTPAAAAADSGPAPLASPSTPSHSIAPAERELMQLLLLHSRQTILIGTGLASPDEEGQPYPSEPTEFVLGPFVQRELEIDGLSSLYTPLFAHFMEELQALPPERQDPLSYFTNHPNPDLRSLSTELLSGSEALEYRPSYTSSLAFTRMMGQSSEADAESQLLQQAEETLYYGSLTMRVCNSYKMAMLIKYMVEINQQIKQAQRAGDLETLTELVQELSLLNESKRRLSALLGDRTIVG